MIKLKKILIVVILTILQQVTLVAEETCQTNCNSDICYYDLLSNLMELSAIKQYQINDLLERSKTNQVKEVALTVNEIHDLSYSICAKILRNSKPNVSQRVILSETFSRIGWFSLYEFSGAMTDNPSFQELITKSIEFNPRNPIALYQFASYLMTESEDKHLEKIQNLLKKAIKLKPQFPEARLALGMLYVRHKLKSISEHSKIQEEILSSLHDFSPELYLFEKAYPARMNKITIAGKNVERKVYKDDYNRFKLTSRSSHSTDKSLR